MKFIVRDTDYAMRALIFMAKRAEDAKKDIVTVDDVIEKEALPERFLRRILQKLARSKILASHKGKDGGFTFVKRPSEIYFTDVIRIFQGDIDLTNCFLKREVCPNVRRCPLRKELKDISLLIEQRLRKITVAKLLKECSYGKTKNR